MKSDKTNSGSSRRQVLAGMSTALVSLPALAAGQASGRTQAQNAPASTAGDKERFGQAYTEKAVQPFLNRAVYQGQRLSLPMLDLAFSKEAALTPHLWGLAYEEWRPNMEEEGLSVFIQGYENRGPENARKRIYVSAITPDLYQPMYAPKIRNFLDRLFDARNAGQPMMRAYYDNYFDLYWDLHLGVRGEAVPPAARQLGQSFNYVIGLYDPRQPETHEHYMRVRQAREELKTWIDQRLQDVLDGKVERPEATFAHYWLTNGAQSQHFRRRDVVFETMHNFVALSQWGNMLYRVAERLDETNGDPAIKASFAQVMGDAPDEAGQEDFTPLDRFVMELFRVISPNAGSLSTLVAAPQTDPARQGYIFTPHPQNSRDPRHWADPDAFDPDRYLSVPTSEETGEDHCKDLGLVRCPFSQTAMPVKDGRAAEIANSGFGTVYPVVGGQAYPVVDYAGHAPFGFGYRRCAGEWLTVDLFKDVLRKIHRDGITFARLPLDKPERIPVGPTTVIEDNLGFSRG